MQPDPKPKRTSRAGAEKITNDTDSDSFTKAYDAVYGSTNKKNRFRKDWLPEPLEYYRRHLHTLRVHNDWASTKCPFHEDIISSLSVNIKNGGYFCHACGTKGGDVVDFHQRLFEINFIDAAQDLGAWDDG